MKNTMQITLELLKQLTRDTNTAPSWTQRRARITLDRLDNKFDALQRELLKIQDEIVAVNRKFDF